MRRALLSPIPLIVKRSIVSLNKNVYRFHAIQILSRVAEVSIPLFYFYIESKILQ